MCPPTSLQIPQKPPPHHGTHPTIYCPSCMCQPSATTSTREAQFSLRVSCVHQVNLSSYIATVSVLNLSVENDARDRVTICMQFIL